MAPKSMQHIIYQLFIVCNIHTAKSVRVSVYFMFGEAKANQKSTCFILTLAYDGLRVSVHLSEERKRMQPHQAIA